MSTSKQIYFPDCKSNRINGSLFDLLLKISESERIICDKCQSNNCVVTLKFNVALGAPIIPCQILDVFKPDSPMKWNDLGKDIIYYPFLVILKYDHGNEIWFPYWHEIIENKKRKLKYGQWSPIIRIAEFQAMINKAKEKGYLK